MRRVVILDRPIEEECNVGGVAGNVCVAGRLGISFRFAACLNAVEEVSDVESRWVATDLFDFATCQQGWGAQC